MSEAIQMIKFFSSKTVGNIQCVFPTVLETIQNCGLFLVTDFANWDNCNMKIGNLANLVPKLDNDQKSC